VIYYKILYYLSNIERVYMLKQILIIAMLLSANAEASKSQISKEYDKVGRVVTLNKMGWMHPVIDDVAAKFIEFGKNNKEAKLLEIGAAYGYASEAALKTGVQVWVNDLDVRHLEIFKENIKDKSLMSHATLIPGYFPDELKLESDFFDAILSVRVFHFFSPAKLEKAASECFRILKKGGKVYIVVDTPYQKNWSNFIPVYEKKKKEGDSYPGYFTNPSKYNEKASKFIPNELHYLDPEVLTRVFKKAGFKIELAEFMNRTDYPQDKRFDGRETAGLIAVKP